MRDDAARRAADQLDAIASLDLALSGAGLDYWLFGGWAVDFWAGRLTRDHNDIDAAAWRRDYDKIRAALLAAGWRHTPLEDDAHAQEACEPAPNEPVPSIANARRPGACSSTSFSASA
ncbi:MAG TPA: hypothetical protein VGP69_00350 [Gaiellaceae bacterium]|jgi:hypothetical protein|nr:hypothetical protein [Gaiellaceae bacterium]